jgi:hypothetical protein
MRNLDIADTRDKLMIYARAGLLKESDASPMPLLDAPTAADSE